MPKRIACNLVLVTSLFFAPWWVTLALGIIATFYFSSYYEFMVVGALFDILYGVTGNIAIGYSVFGFVVSVLLFLIITRVKRELR